MVQTNFKTVGDERLGEIISLLADLSRQGQSYRPPIGQVTLEAFIQMDTTELDDLARTLRTMVAAHRDNDFSGFKLVQPLPNLKSGPELMLASGVKIHPITGKIIWRHFDA